MDFGFDQKKNKLNLKRHGISLNDACYLWEDTHVIIPAKNVSGEFRYAILGEIKQKVYMAIFTRRGKVFRIISCHRAGKKWEKIYYEHTKTKK